MRDVDVAVVVQRDPAWERRDGKRREKLAIGRKLLHAGVVKVGDEQFVGGAGGDADRKVELPFGGALLTPLEHEAGCTGGGFFGARGRRLPNLQQPQP